MAFTGQTMPKIKLVHGVSKQVIDPVSVVGNGTRETRRKQNRYERFVWNYPSRSILQASKQELYDFFRAMGSSLDSFMFQDPDMPEAVNMQLSRVYDVGFDDYWYFEIPSTGVSTGHPLFNHPDITYELTFTIAGTQVYDQGVGIEVHSTNGRPIINFPGSFALSAANSNANMLVSGPLYLTARLNSPLTWTISAMDKSSSGANCSPSPTIVDIGDIQLIEVFERA